MALTYLPAAQANAAIAAMFPTATGVWLGLNTSSPSTTGANEATGGSYARQALSVGSPSSGVETSTNAQNFTSMPSLTITHFTIWSASTSGTYLGGGALGSSLTVPSGATVAVAIGGTTVGVQG